MEYIDIMNMMVEIGEDVVSMTKCMVPCRRSEFTTRLYTSVKVNIVGFKRYPVTFDMWYSSNRYEAKEQYVVYDSAVKKLWHSKVR